MIGIGTIINTVAVACGGLIGMKLKNGIKQSRQEIMMQACGVATVFIGVGGVLSKMLVIQDGRIETKGTCSSSFHWCLALFSGNGWILRNGWMLWEKKSRKL